MNAREISTEIQKHLEKQAKNTALERNVVKDKRRRIKGQRRAEVVGGTLLEAGTPEEHVEIGDNLYFFYHSATVVRWPKPIVGENKNFEVQVIPDGKHPDDVVLDETFIDGFEGKFYIDKKGQLFITPEAGWKVDVVVFGNPGGETGSNSNC
jgi:hypothetical protein